MRPASRANVASSFTVIKGAIIDETYSVFAQWDLTRSKRDNLDRALLSASVRVGHPKGRPTIVVPHEDRYYRIQNGSTSLAARISRTAPMPKTATRS